MAMNSGRFFLITTVAFIGAGLLTAKMTPAKPGLQTTAPRPEDFASTANGVLAMQAMLQMAKEMQALGQVNTAKVYADQASNPPPGTAARALEHVADEFEKSGEFPLAQKLRSVASQIYQPPAATPATTPAS